MANFSLEPVEHDPFEDAKKFASTLPPSPDELAARVNITQQDKEYQDWLSRYNNVGPNLTELGRGVVNVLSNATGDNVVKARSAIDAVTLPGRVAQGSVDINDPEVQNWAPGMAMSLVTSGLGAAQPGSAGIFGGRLASSANLKKLAMAEHMESSGYHPDDIRFATGWEKGIDNNWRFEIDDSKMKVKNLGGTGQYKLSDLVDHPELYAAYPELKNMDVNLLGTHPTEYGNFNPNDNSLNLYDKGRTPSILAHEIQHAVQLTENHAFGNAPDYKPTKNIANALNVARSAEFERQDRKVQGMFDDYWEKNVPHLGYEDAWDHYMDNDAIGRSEAIKRYNMENARQVTPFDVYHRTAGEVEARNVEARLGMNPYERLLRSPESTEDLPRNRQYLLDNIETYGKGKEYKALLKYFGAP